MKTLKFNVGDTVSLKGYPYIPMVIYKIEYEGTGHEHIYCDWLTKRYEIQTRMFFVAELQIYELKQDNPNQS